MIKDDHKIPRDDGKLKSASGSLKRRKTVPSDKSDRGRGIFQPKETSTPPNLYRDEGSLVGSVRTPTDCVVSTPVTEYDRIIGPRDAYPNHGPTHSLVSTAISSLNLSPHNEFSSFQPLNSFQASPDSSLLNQRHHIDANQLARTINMGETGYDNGTANWNISQGFPGFH
jgi:hypothetical protein